MKQIEIKSLADTFVTVDDSDFESMSKFEWRTMRKKAHDLSDTLVAYRNVGRNQKIYMHREIMQPSKGFKVRHRNCNGLDNRLENLELVAMGDSIR